MDFVADADGNPDQDIRCFPNYEDKQEEGVEIQYDLVLGDRLCCIENQGVYLLPEKNLLKEFLMRKIPRKRIWFILAIDAIRFYRH